VLTCVCVWWHATLAGSRQLGEALLLILDGSATRRDESGEEGAEAALVEAGEGEYVGDESLFQSHGSLRVERLTVVAASTVTLAVFTFAALRRMADDRPDLAVDIITHAVQRRVKRALRASGLPVYPQTTSPPPCSPLRRHSQHVPVAATAELAAPSMQSSLDSVSAADASPDRAQATAAAAAATVASSASLPNGAEVLSPPTERRLELFRRTQAAARFWTGFDEDELQCLARHMLVLQLQATAVEQTLAQGATSPFVGVLASGELELRHDGKHVARLVRPRHRTSPQPKGKP
jgi:CRP-like cAMP-binding protein